MCPTRRIVIGVVGACLADFRSSVVNMLSELDFGDFCFQSIMFFAAFTILIGGLLLLTIIITWICQCCKVVNTSVKSRKRVRQLSSLLFAISIFCFFFLGFCLFGNEFVNRGITSSIASANDIIQNFKLASAQCNRLNDTRIRMRDHMVLLRTIMQEEVRKHTAINKTAFNDVENWVNSSIERIETFNYDVDHIRNLLLGTIFIEKAKVYSNRIELERQVIQFSIFFEVNDGNFRWILCTILLSIMFVVLFAGIIGFCRRSKKGAIVFSGLGLTVFIVGWLLFSTVFPATVSLADFCADGGNFIRKHLSNDSVDILNFYRKCDPQSTYDNIPLPLKAENITVKLSAIQSLQRTIELTLKNIFNESFKAFFSFQIEDVLNYLDDDISRSLRGFGAFSSTVACYTYHYDFEIMKQGFCVDGIIGASILTLSLFFLGFFMFTLLLIVSKSWHLFARLPSDYIEVDEEDPFFPRTNDSTIPVDIYGTHVYNPRTRLANSFESTSNHIPPSTALLDSAGPSTPLWQRGIGDRTTTVSAGNAPPAVGSNRFFMMQRG
ncbi:unnamed protein product [Dracunculus medinensis]|uniref:Protein tweety homolog n=1 Tax=Dracunculus medinensis TaxID=318479 RepID=A0A158Q386_DRAME|nr:unnamed protein product [Dracunculus medinensis]